MNKLIFFSFLILVVSCQKDEVKTLSFGDCKIEYMSYRNGQDESNTGNYISNKWLLESANRKLGLCLCEKYLRKPGNEIKAKILEIYNAEEEYFEKDYPKNIAFDTLLKKRMKIFDPTILLD